MKCFSREWSKKAGEMERRLKNYLSTALVLQQPGREKPLPIEDNQTEWRADKKETRRDIRKKE